MILLVIIQNLILVYISLTVYQYDTGVNSSSYVGTAPAIPIYIKSMQ